LNKILFVWYSFPPNPGLGGRRWAKSSKYITKSRHYVEVINAKLRTDKLSTRSKDAQLLRKKNHAHSLPTGYPEIIKKIPETLFQKIQYRLSLEYLKLKAKGNLYNKSSLWHLNLIPFVQKKLVKAFDTIICTAAPFHYLGEVAQLFHTDDLNHTKRTKLHENIHLRKKVAVFSKYGELNKYVEDKGIGYSLEPASIAEALIKIKKDCLEDNLTIPKDYTFSDYSIPNISKSLLSIIKQ
jgi:hypothetical protein